MKQFIVSKFPVLKLVLFIIFSLSLSSEYALAQNFTKQRTTGTYLPVNAAAIKREELVDISIDDEFSLPDGTVKIETPKEFYSENLRFAIAKITWENNSSIPSIKIDGESFIGKEVYEITATDTKTGLPVLEFDRNITIIFRYLDPDVADSDESKLQTRFFDRIKQEWTIIDSSLDTGSNTITVKTDHLTLFAITGPTDKPTSTPTTTNTTDTNNTENTGIPAWQLIIAGLILVSILGIGGWYLYTIYLEATSDPLTSNESLIFGDIQEIVPIDKKKPKNPEKTTTNPPTNSSPTNNNSQKPSPKPTQIPSEEKPKPVGTPPKPTTPNSTTNTKPPVNPDEEIWIDF